MQPTANYDPFDRTNGNGSRNAEEDWLDENTTAAENQWSTAETTFYYWEASPNQRNKFEDLYAAHHGKGEEDRRSTIRRSYIVNDAQTFANVLNLPRPQRERVVELARTLNFSTNRFGGKPYEKILIALCSLVSDEALSRNLEKYKNNSEIVERRLVLTDRFRDLMEVNDLGSREHNRIRQMIRDKCEHF